jgi:RNA recognition motif-containing protein
LEIDYVTMSWMRITGKVDRGSMSSASTELGTDSESSDMAADRDRHAKSASTEWRTTVMLRNLPNNYTREMLLEHLDSLGFSGRYNFFYMPIDFNSEASLGYAFVNLTTPEYAQLLMATFDGFHDWVIPTRKKCIVNWSHPHQGLESNIERYRNSPVMHKDVPDAFQPAMFDETGMRVRFPQPRKKLRCPRLRALVAPTSQVARSVSKTVNIASAEAVKG